MSLRLTLSNVWSRFQGELFPALAAEVGPLPETHKRLVQVLDRVEVERLVAACQAVPGRPLQDRRALARAFIAKLARDLPTTRDLIDRVKIDATLRRLCGWPRAGAVPSGATFSRAFAEFSETRLHPPRCSSHHQTTQGAHAGQHSAGLPFDSPHRHITHGRDFRYPSLRYIDDTTVLWLLLHHREYPPPDTFTSPLRIPEIAMRGPSGYLALIEDIYRGVYLLTTLRGQEWLRADRKGDFDSIIDDGRKAMAEALDKESE